MREQRGRFATTAESACSVVELCLASFHVLWRRARDPEAERAPAHDELAVSGSQAMRSYVSIASKKESAVKLAGISTTSILAPAGPSAGEERIVSRMPDDFGASGKSFCRA